MTPRRTPPIAEDRHAPLAGHENAEVRDVLDDRRHWKWFRSLAAKAAAAAILSGGLVVVAKDHILTVGKFLAWMLKG